MARTAQRSSVLIGSYLACIVAANLSVAALGPWALPFTAIVLIPFDLVTRDLLQERWSRRGVWIRMAALIAAGSLLSLATNPASARVAAASAMSFAAAGIVDTVVYTALRSRGRLLRINVSNLASAAVDSVLFPAIAFSLLSFQLSATQTLIKCAGGLAWSLLLVRWFGRDSDVARLRRPRPACCPASCSASAPIAGRT